MQVNNLYVYFNKSGQVVSRTPYCENGEVRQGSTFILNFLFEKDYIKPGDTVSAMFKWPGQNEANTFPYVSFYEDYNLDDKDTDNSLYFLNMGIFRNKRLLTLQSD